MGCLWSRNVEDAINENTATFKRSRRCEKSVFLVCVIINVNVTIRSDDDLSNYMYQYVNGVNVGKTPGQLNGEDFIIEDCKVHVIYDYMHNDRLCAFCLFCSSCRKLGYA